MNVLTELKENGTTRGYEQHMATSEEFTRSVKIPEFFALEQRKIGRAHV